MKLKYIWYRIRQAGFSLFMYLAPIRKEKLYQVQDAYCRFLKKLKKVENKKYW